MKLTRNAMVLFTFVAVFVIILVIAAVQGTLFEPSLVKSILVAVFFAGWFALLAFCLFSLVIPRVRAATMNSRNQNKQRRAMYPLPTDEMPMRSPRSNLPVRERISTYVEERRREEGISAPALLRPTRSTQVVAPAASHITQSVNSTEELPGIDGDLDLGGMGPEGTVDADDFGLDDSFDSGGGDSGFDSIGDSSDGNLPDFDGDLSVGSDDLDDSFDKLDGNFDELEDVEDHSIASDDSDASEDSLDNSEFEDLDDASEDSLDNSEFEGLDDASEDSLDNSEFEGLGDTSEDSLDNSEFEGLGDTSEDSFDADGGDELMAMDDAEMNDSMLDDSSMESDGGLPDFDGDLDLSDDGDLMLADNDFEDIEEIGDLEP